MGLLFGCESGKVGLLGRSGVTNVFSSSSWKTFRRGLNFNKDPRRLLFSVKLRACDSFSKRSSPRFCCFPVASLRPRCIPVLCCRGLPRAASSCLYPDGIEHFPLPAAVLDAYHPSAEYDRSRD